MMLWFVSVFSVGNWSDFTAYVVYADSADQVEKMIRDMRPDGHMVPRGSEGARDFKELIINIKPINVSEDNPVQEVQYIDVVG